MKYKVTVVVEANSESEALEEVGYRIYVHKEINSIAQRVVSIDIEKLYDQ